MVANGQQLRRINKKKTWWTRATRAPPRIPNRRELQRLSGRTRAGKSRAFVGTVSEPLENCAGTNQSKCGTKCELGESDADEPRDANQVNREHQRNAKCDTDDQPEAGKHTSRKPHG